MKTINFLLFISLLFLSFIFTSCDDDDLEDCINDLGRVTTEVRDVDDFHSISLDGVGNIYLTQGDEHELIIDANERVLDILETKVSRDLLSIDLRGCINGDNYVLDLFITTPDIRLLSLNGVGNITAENYWVTEDLTIELNGVGNFNLYGEAEHLDIVSNGVGNVNAFDLITHTCDVTVRGTGNIEVNVIESLDVRIEGAANIYYIGDPDISVTINGAGNVFDAN